MNHHTCHRMSLSSCRGGGVCAIFLSAAIYCKLSYLRNCTWACRRCRRVETWSCSPHWTSTGWRRCPPSTWTACWITEPPRSPPPSPPPLNPSLLPALPPPQTHRQPRLPPHLFCLQLWKGVSGCDKVIPSSAFDLAK